jgi:hypothetical protein
MMFRFGLKNNPAALSSYFDARYSDIPCSIFKDVTVLYNCSERASERFKRGGGEIRAEKMRRALEIHVSGVN